jgi:lipopolysaccharide export system protein LptC
MIYMRSTDRVRVVLLFTLTAALALGSFWMLEAMRRSAGPDAANANRNDPDYYVEDFQFVRVSNNGQAQYSINGQKLTHYPADDTHKIDQPIVNSLSSERPPMQATSKTATIDRINSKLHMYDDVHLDRAATAERERLQLDSEYLLLLTDQDIMQTDKPVSITQGQSVLKGTGMVANNATGELRLAGNVNVTYRPPSNAAGRPAR